VKSFFGQSFLAAGDAAEVKPRPAKTSPMNHARKQVDSVKVPKNPLAHARGSSGTNARSIGEYSRDELVAVLKKVVKRKWILREDAIRESAQVLGFARVGRRIQAAFKSAITGAI